MKRRVRGTGSIEQYQAASGVWRHRARVVLASGRRVPVGVFKTEREAQIALDDALAKYRAGAAVDTLVGITVRQWGAPFLDQRDEQGIRGIKTERNRWKNLVDASPLADVILAAVVRRDAKQWLAWLQGRRIKYKHAHSRNGKKLSRVTLQNALNLVRKAFDVALDDELVTVNPFAGVRLPRNPGRTHEPWTYLTLDEQNALIACSGSLVWFALATGLRQGEQWSLRWDDVHQDHVVVRYGSDGAPTKSGKLRRVPLVPLAMIALKREMEFRGRTSSPLVFPALGGSRRDKGEPAGWKIWIRAAGITRNVRWHDLRHTCASSLVAGWWGRKWSLEEVKGMLGHASITTTERYAHLAESEIQKAAKETGGMPDVSPASPDTIKPTAGATSGIRIPDLRFTKACDTVATAPSSQIKSPLAGHQDSRPPRDGRGPGQPGGRDGELVTPGTLPSDPKPALTSNANIRSGDRAPSSVGGDRAHRSEQAVERRAGGLAQSAGTFTAEVATHAGLSPMLLATAYRDVRNRRARRGFYYAQCDACEGSGKDGAERGGRCVYCHGTGAVELPDDDPFANDDRDVMQRRGR